MVFVLACLSIHVSTDDLNVLFGNVSNKGRYLIMESSDICFVTHVDGALARDDRCAWRAIKSSTYNYRLCFLYAISWFLSTRTEENPTHPMAALTEFFHIDDEAKVNPGHWHNGWSVHHWFWRPGFNPGWVIQKTQKWYLMTLCLTLSIIKYGSRVKWNHLGKGVMLFLHLGEVAIEKWALESLLAMVANFYFTYSANIYVLAFI